MIAPDDEDGVGTGRRLRFMGSSPRDDTVTTKAESTYRTSRLQGNCVPALTRSVLAVGAEET